MVPGQGAIFAATSDWATALLFVGLLLAWWVFLAWWISRYGGRDVAVTFRSPKPPDEALRDWTDYYGTWLAGAGYDVVDHRADRIALVGRYRPRWEVAVAFFLFPIGLLALLGSKPADLVATTTRGGIEVEGTIHRGMAKELEKDAAAGVLDEPSAEPATPAPAG